MYLCIILPLFMYASLSTAITLTINTSSEITLYRNNYLVRQFQPGIHKLRTRLSRRDKLSSFLLGSNEAEETTLTIRSEGHRRPLIWRHSSSNEVIRAHAKVNPTWKSTCKWATADHNQTTSTMQYANKDLISPPMIVFQAEYDDRSCKTNPFKEHVLIHKSSDVSKKTRKIVLSIAVDHKAWIYLNGKHLGDVKSSKHLWQKKYLEVKHNDVIFIKAITKKSSDGRGGVIAVVKDKNEYFVTGSKKNQGGWRICEIRDKSQVSKMMKPYYEDCGKSSIWSYGDIIQNGISKMKQFPYGNGNPKYIWAPEVKEKLPIIGVRFVVGKPNRCNKHHQKIEYKDDNLCNCALDKNKNINSKCYYFIKPKSNACKSRKCSPRHLCSVNNEFTGTICIKKKVTERIVPLKDGINQCKMVSHNAYMYVPYEQVS